MRKFTPALIFFSLATLASALDQTAYTAAVELYTQRKPLEAQKAFEVLAATAPDDANIQFYLGRLALQRGDQENAVVHLEKAVALSPQDSRMQLRLGDAYGLTAQKAGLFSKMSWAGKCRTAYEKAVALDPKNIDARWSLMEYCRQAPSIAGGGNDKALVQAIEIKKLDLGRGRIAVASVYVSDKKYDLAFSEFEEALKADPTNYAALFQTGRLAALSGQRLDGGLEVLRQCLAMTPPDGQPGHAAAHWRIGNILEKINDKPGARAAYEAALKVDPKFPPAIESLKKL
ncbi:MAG: tetratricopeptide repeat protein [Opitutae bacterium]